MSAFEHVIEFSGSIKCRKFDHPCENGIFCEWPWFMEVGW